MRHNMEPYQKNPPNTRFEKMDSVIYTTDYSRDIWGVIIHQALLDPFNWLPVMLTCKAWQTWALQLLKPHEVSLLDFSVHSFELNDVETMVADHLWKKRETEKTNAKNNFKCMRNIRNVTYHCGTISIEETEQFPYTLPDISQPSSRMIAIKNFVSTHSFKKMVIICPDNRFINLLFSFLKSEGQQVFKLDSIQWKRCKVQETVDGILVSTRLAFENEEDISFAKCFDTIVLAGHLDHIPLVLTYHHSMVPYSLHIFFASFDYETGLSRKTNAMKAKSIWRNRKLPKKCRNCGKIYQPRTLFSICDTCYHYRGTVVWKLRKCLCVLRKVFLCRR